MTVTPRWPQDDAAASSSADHRMAAENGADGSMPPILFSLPNLNPAPKNPAPKNPAPKNSAPTIPDPVPAPAIPVAISPAAADAAAMETQAADLSSSSEATSRQSFHERPAPVENVPAGRSWMEVARQHGVVVMLLLIVVATAIFTGRDSKNDLADDAIADAVELGQIDQGFASDVPLPVHHHDSESGVVASQHSLESAPGELGAVSPKVDPIVQTKDAGPPSRDTGTSFASLEPPQVGVTQNSSDFNSNTTAVDGAAKVSSQNEVAAIEFVPPQVDAQTVANRVSESTSVDSDVAFNPPSLESLAESLADGDPAQSNEMGGVQANSFVPVFTLPVSSQTPTGISNWLKFLPALPNDTSN